MDTASGATRLAKETGRLQKIEGARFNTPDARRFLPTWREGGTDRQRNAASRKQRQEISRAWGVNSSLVRCLLVTHNAAAIQSVVDAQSELGLIPTRTVPEHVVEVNVRRVEGIDGNYLVGNGPAGEAKVIPHRADAFVKDAKIKMLL